ncbi:phosphotransferase family protein [Jeotgalibacillus terrae]|uniref:Phosphotransferase family protein n=1 Tax=Jeotgalibacillus terrae TaxID=587735 RepID=A0ABW5ZHQ6_9BACL|nr:phosphotransferase [Jeotgalibacillus terrae]MBM7578754.1 aminoglycoside 3'-phosphotransferase-2 [Jeotgalibacillus terrae]
MTRGLKFNLDKDLLDKLEVITGSIHRAHMIDEQGWTSAVHKISAVNGTYILKSSFKEKYREWLKTEAEVLKKLKSQQEIPVPEYVHYIEETGRNHLLMSYEEGMTLTKALREAVSHDEKKQLMKSFGQLLYWLHETETAHFELTGDWLEEELKRAERYLEAGECDGDRELLEKLKANRLAEVKQTVIHGDCTTDNVMVRDGEVRLFIDVAGMTVGDPRYDVALAIRKVMADSELTEAFYEGYGLFRLSSREFNYFENGLYEFF